MKNNECIEHYISCPSGANKETCLAKPYSSSVYKKCIYDENKGCIEQDKECSEYEEGMSCSSLYTPDEDKMCFMDNGQCSAKYIYWESYKGKDKATCEAIIPYSDEKASLKNSHKCVLDKDNNCVKVAKECKEAKTFHQCVYEINPPENKKCVYQNGECQEQYIDCNTYNTVKSGQIDKSECESIIILDVSDLLTTKKCQFIEATSECQTKEKTCPDFKQDDYEITCHYLKHFHHHITSVNTQIQNAKKKKSFVWNWIQKMEWQKKFMRKLLLLIQIKNAQ